MKYKLLFMSLISSFIYSSQHEYTLRIENKNELVTFVNGVKCYCDCGRSPVLAMVLFGKLDLYCEEHMPEIERVQRLTPERLAELFRKES